MKKENIKIAPSILSANFAKMGEEVAELEKCGADFIHCDIMDGVFVPNITFGIKMINDIKKYTSLVIDTHLMIVEPQNYIDKFASAGADYITIHYEACLDKTLDTLKLIKNAGAKCGIVIKPDTPANKIMDIVPFCDMITVMSVFPGFGGQKFIPSTLENIKYFRKNIDLLDKNILLEVDGGISTENCKIIKEAGANVLVVGSAIFNSRNKRETINILRGN